MRTEPITLVKVTTTADGIGGVTQERETVRETFAHAQVFQSIETNEAGEQYTVRRIQFITRDGLDYSQDISQVTEDFNVVTWRGKDYKITSLPEPLPGGMVKLTSYA
jgi:head-tail adaptor